ncbi:hypothetical protein BsIDN1_58220 [Bacillus safensis]|uniref:4-hydroxythreonine-4-phosphate dehydrogenase n=1 Tax=Bacillus safensis TaxID=561879 RepID=A0A5S9MJ50_BACIA|nr:hypothetical protein BsIDN1_58220 [Bacillus safensis]
MAMYHDQGHGPIKVLGLESGVNITVGLPIIRTSVDHGTAFDIAGTGKADSASMEEAIRQAIMLSGTRENQYEKKKKPLRGGSFFSSSYTFRHSY